MEMPTLPRKPQTVHQIVACATADAKLPGDVIISETFLETRVAGKACNSARQRILRAAGSTF